MPRGGRNSKASWWNNCCVFWIVLGVQGSFCDALPFIYYQLRCFVGSILYARFIKSIVFYIIYNILHNLTIQLYILIFTSIYCTLIIFIWLLIFSFSSHLQVWICSIPFRTIATTAWRGLVYHWPTRWSLVASWSVIIGNLQGTVSNAPCVRLDLKRLCETMLRHTFWCDKIQYKLWRDHNAWA